MSQSYHSSSSSEESYIEKFPSGEVELVSYDKNQEDTEDPTKMGYTLLRDSDENDDIEYVEEVGLGKKIHVGSEHDESESVVSSEYEDYDDNSGKTQSYSKGCL